MKDLGICLLLFKQKTIRNRLQAGTTPQITHVTKVVISLKRLIMIEDYLGQDFEVI